MSEQPRWLFGAVPRDSKCRLRCFPRATPRIERQCATLRRLVPYLAKHGAGGRGARAAAA